MDSTVSTALTAGIGEFATEATGQIASVLPVALPVVITVGGLFLAIRLFRAIAHV